MNYTEKYCRIKSMWKVVCVFVWVSVCACGWIHLHIYTNTQKIHKRKKLILANRLRVLFIHSNRSELNEAIHFYQFVCHINKDYEQSHCKFVAVQLTAVLFVWLSSSGFFSLFDVFIVNFLSQCGPHFNQIFILNI